MFLEIGAITLSVASLVGLLIIRKLGLVGISTCPVVGGRFKCKSWQGHDKNKIKVKMGINT